jgi:hypothetical protein
MAGMKRVATARQEALRAAEERERRERMKSMMENPRVRPDGRAWPMWPWLPIKNYRERQPNGFPKLGAMHADHLFDPKSGSKPRVYQTNPDFIARRPYFPQPEWTYEEFADTDALLDAGWEVD